MLDIGFGEGRLRHENEIMDARLRASYVYQWNNRYGMIKLDMFESALTLKMQVHVPPNE